MASHSLSLFSPSLSLSLFVVQRKQDVLTDLKGPLGQEQGSIQDLSSWQSLEESDCMAYFRHGKPTLLFCTM